jgi:hypothetical protein
VSLLAQAREELSHVVQTIEEGDYVSSYRSTLYERRAKLVAKVADLEIAHARELAGEAAIEFLREHGQYLQEISCGGLPRTEIDDDLDRVMGRIVELNELESSR